MSSINTAHEDSVKIVFNFHSDLLDAWTVETVWAEAVNLEKGLYKIDNIPFYASIAVGDIVFAQDDDLEKRLTYQETIEYSGNSTIQVVVLEPNFDTNDIRDIFNDLNCDSEKFNDGYFVINVPAEIDYIPIKDKLENLQAEGIIDYAEPCLSNNHWY